MVSVSEIANTSDGCEKQAVLDWFGSRPRRCEPKQLGAVGGNHSIAAANELHVTLLRRRIKLSYRTIVSASRIGLMHRPDAPASHVGLM